MQPTSVAYIVDRAPPANRLGSLTLILIVSVVAAAIATPLFEPIWGDQAKPGSSVFADPTRPGPNPGLTPPSEAN